MLALLYNVTVTSITTIYSTSSTTIRLTASTIAIASSNTSVTATILLDSLHKPNKIQTCSLLSSRIRVTISHWTKLQQYPTI